AGVRAPRMVEGHRATLSADAPAHERAVRNRRQSNAHTLPGLRRAGLALRMHVDRMRRGLRCGLRSLPVGAWKRHFLHDAHPKRALSGRHPLAAPTARPDRQPRRAPSGSPWRCSRPTGNVRRSPPPTGTRASLTLLCGRAAPPAAPRSWSPKKPRDSTIVGRAPRTTALVRGLPSPPADGPQARPSGVAETEPSEDRVMSLARTCSIGTASRRRRAPHRVGVAFWILAASASALAATHAHGATLGGGTGGRPGGTTPPTPLATPTPAPSPGTPIGRPGIDLPPPAKVALPIPCSTPAPIFTTCAPGEHRIDEIATRYFNTTLMRGCGRFIMHEVPGNAEVTSGASGLGSGPIDPFGEQHRHQVPVRADIPEGDGVNQLEGLPDGDRIVDLGPRTAGA